MEKVMIQLSKHFHEIESYCKDGTPLPMEFFNNAVEVAKNMEIVRKKLGNTPIHVISWYRTAKYNKKVKGATHSQHLTASAMDFTHNDLRPTQIYKIINKMMNEKQIKQGGLGLYNTFVHYDIRGNKSRWDLRT